MSDLVDVHLMASFYCASNLDLKATLFIFIRTREFQSRFDVLRFSLGRASSVLIMFLKCSWKNGAEAQCS